jgi:hypothetical protein
MTFAESEHPRATDGKFAEKVGAAPSISLDVKPPITAKVVHQQWIGDYAVDTGEETEFDIRAVLDAAPLEDIRSMESSGDRDWLHFDAVNAGLIEPAEGPFYIDTFAAEEDLEEYIAAREAAGQEDPVAELEPSQKLVRERVGAALQGARGALPLSIITMDGSEDGDLSASRTGHLVADGILRAQHSLNALAVDSARLDESDRKHLSDIDQLRDLISYDRLNQATVTPESRQKVVRIVAGLNDYLWNRENHLSQQDTLESQPAASVE